MYKRVESPLSPRAENGIMQRRNAGDTKHRQTATTMNTGKEATRQHRSAAKEVLHLGLRIVVGDCSIETDVCPPLPRAQLGSEELDKR